MTRDRLTRTAGRTPARAKAADLLRSGQTIYRGSLIQYSRRCGAAGCQCAQGKLHKGWALSLSVAGKTQVVYLPDDLRREVAADLRRHQGLMALLERIAQADTRVLRHRARRYKQRQ